MKGAPNETRTHSCRFARASLLTITPPKVPKEIRNEPELNDKTKEKKPINKRWKIGKKTKKRFYDLFYQWTQPKSWIFGEIFKILKYFFKKPSNATGILF